MGFGTRFRTTTLLEIFNFKEAEQYKKLQLENSGKGVDVTGIGLDENNKEQEKINFMAKLNTTGGLLLSDDETAESYLESELLIAGGAMRVAVQDLDTGKDFNFEVPLEVSLDKVGQLTPEFLTAAVQDIKMTQGVADIVQIII